MLWVILKYEYPCVCPHTVHNNSSDKLGDFKHPLTTYEVMHEMMRQTYHQDQNLQSQRCDVVMKPLKDVDTLPPQENCTIRELAELLVAQKDCFGVSRD